MDGLSSVRMTIEEQGGKLTGAVLFYLIRRDPGSPDRFTRLSRTDDFAELQWQDSHVQNEPPARASAAASERSASQLPVGTTGPDKGMLYGPERADVEIVIEMP